MMEIPVSQNTQKSNGLWKTVYLTSGIIGKNAYSCYYFTLIWVLSLPLFFKLSFLGLHVSSDVLLGLPRDASNSNIAYTVTNKSKHAEDTESCQVVSTGLQLVKMCETFFNNNNNNNKMGWEGSGRAGREIWKIFCSPQPYTGTKQTTLPVFEDAGDNHATIKSVLSRGMYLTLLYCCWESFLLVNQFSISG